MLSPCAEPGCPTLSDTTRCDNHTRAKRKHEDRRRPSARQRGYTRQWQRTRAAFLAHHPVCKDCGAQATVADHSPLSRSALLDAGILNPDSPAFLEPRCKPCHDRRTVLQDGGFGRAPENTQAKPVRR